MKYHELLELYKKKELAEEQMQQIEADIERQEAISEYLFDKEQWENRSEWESEAVGALTDEALTDEAERMAVKNQQLQTEAQDFTRIVNRSIRRAFLKMGAVITAITVVVALLVVNVLPQVVDSFYYNPAQPIGENDNRLSLDMSVYTEVCMPGYKRDHVSVQSRGYGLYDFLIYQHVSYNGSFTNVAGTIEKGRMRMYDPNALKAPTGNAFAWFQMEGDSRHSLSELIDSQGKPNTCAAGDVEQANGTLQNLNEHTKYMAYVTLDTMMPYEEFMTFLESTEQDARLGGVWCAVCTINGVADVDTSQNGTQEYLEVEGQEEPIVMERISMFRADNLGFNCDLMSSTSLEWDREKYPNLLLWDNASIEANEAAGIGVEGSLREDMKNEAFMQKHFVSMLRYLADQEAFLEMMNEQPERFDNAADYVEQNGLMVYGYAGFGDKETILKVNELDEVYEIYTQELR